MPLPGVRELAAAILAARLRGSIALTGHTLMRVILVGALVGGPLAIVLGVVLVVHTKQEQMKTLAQGVIESAAARDSEITAAFSALDRLNDPPCQDADLRDLRSLMIGSTIIQDIARWDHGVPICSAVYGTHVGAIPALAEPGYVLSREQTVWRNVTLPEVPGHKFLLVRHRSFILVVRPGASTPYFGDQYLSISRFFVNHETGQVSWFMGSPIDIPAGHLHSGAAFWERGRYVTLACVGDHEICLALSTYWADILRGNAMPFVMFALAGGLIGSAASVMTMVWRHQRRSLYRRLQQAMLRGDLVMVYQPIVAAGSRALIGAEALMRWTERSGVEISPDVFIPVAEEGGLIGDLTCFAIRSVSRELGDLLRGNPDFRVSINIVADDLEDPRFHDALSVHIDGAGIPPGQIALELTERRAAQVEAADVVINKLRGRGFRIYIDDFGTGYSSLTYLSDLSVDAIKLDKSFTKTVDTSAARSRLVPPIMDMAREIGVPVIVEGVETEFQAAYFARCGASLMQGWLFGRPVGAGELVLAAGVRAKRVAVSGVV